MSIRVKSFIDVLAFFISAILSPYITALVFIIIITYKYSNNLGEFLPWMITFLLFGSVIPGLYVLWLIEIKKIQDIHIADSHDRKVPFWVAGVSAVIGTIILYFLHAARPVIVMAVTYSANAIIVALITQYWKISIHMALFSSIVTVATILFGPVYAWFYLILIPLAWSRVHRKRHTLLQAIAGAMMAFVLTTSVFWLFGYL